MRNDRGDTVHFKSLCTKKLGVRACNLWISMHAGGKVQAELLLQLKAIYSVVSAVRFWTAEVALQR